MNRFVKIILVSNVVTIVVTAASVLLALHYYEGDAAALPFSSSFPLNTFSSIRPAGGHSSKNRFLQEEEEDTEPCCDCTTGEVIEDEDTELPLFCFSASSSRVRVLSSPLETKEILMKDLKLGQHVYVGNGNYEPIYSFGHYYNPKANDKGNNNEKKKGSFLRISYYDENRRNNFIDLTKNHMVYQMETNTFVAASFLQVGDTLQLDKNSSSSSKTTITSIRSIPIPKDGYMAPFTPSGQLVVNGIVASSFVDLLEGEPRMTKLFEKFLSKYYSPQWIAHAFEFPHRLACHYYNNNACTEETYDENGISNWVSKPLRLSQAWISSSSSSSSLFLAPLQIPMMALFGMIMFFFTIAEQIILMKENDTMTVLLMMVFVITPFFIHNYSHRKKKEIGFKKFLN